MMLSVIDVLVILFMLSILVMFILFLVALTLKVLGKVEWSWYFVLSPLFACAYCYTCLFLYVAPQFRMLNAIAS